MDAEIHFSTESEDFQENGVAAVLRVLKDISDNLWRGDEQGIIHDAEGEIIGRWDIRVPH